MLVIITSFAIVNSIGPLRLIESCRENRLIQLRQTPALISRLERAIPKSRRAPIIPPWCAKCRTLWDKTICAKRRGWHRRGGGDDDDDDGGGDGGWWWREDGGEEETEDRWICNACKVRSACTTTRIPRYRWSGRGRRWWRKGGQREPSRRGEIGTNEYFSRLSLGGENTSGRIVGDINDDEDVILPSAERCIRRYVRLVTEWEKNGKDRASFSVPCSGIKARRELTTTRWKRAGRSRVYACRRRCAEEAATRRRRTWSDCYFGARQISRRAGAGWSRLRVLLRLFLPSCFSFCPVDSLSRTGGRFCADDAWHRPKAPRRVTGRSYNSFFFFLASSDPGRVVTVSAMAREIRVQGLRWVRGCAYPGATETWPWETKRIVRLTYVWDRLLV